MKTDLQLTVIFLCFVLVVGVGLVAVSAGAEDTAAGKPLPRVLIIGDSISIGYTPAVQALLKDKAGVERIPVDGAHTGVGLEKLDAWLGDGKWDVIHFNWGLHDLCYRSIGADGELRKDKEKGTLTTTLEQYEKNIEALVKRLRTTKAILIWASTTPVPDGEPGRHKGDEAKYNEVAAKIMKKNGIPIDDLCSCILPRLKEFQRPGGNVHFTDEGSEFLAKQVVSSILAELGKRKP